MDELKRDVKDIKADITDIKVTLAANTASLVTHVKRTELNERRVEKLEKWFISILIAIFIAVITKNYLH